MFRKEKETVDRTPEQIADELRAKLDPKDKDRVRIVADDEIPQAVKMIISMWAGAPEGAREHVEQAMLELVATGIPRAAMLWRLGPYLRADELGTMEEGFADALEYAKDYPELAKEMPDVALTESGAEIARAIDKAVRIRMQLAENEDVVLRDAHLDIISGHAILMRGLKRLNDVAGSVTPDDVDSYDAD